MFTSEATETGRSAHTEVAESAASPGRPAAIRRPVSFLPTGFRRHHLPSMQLERRGRARHLSAIGRTFGTCTAFNLLQILPNISPNSPVRFKAEHKKLTLTFCIILCDLRRINVKKSDLNIKDLNDKRALNANI